MQIYGIIIRITRKGTKIKMVFDSNIIKAREQAFFLCFSAELSQDSLDEIIEAFAEEDEPLDFACRLARGCAEKLSECDEIISRHLKNWRLSRIPKVSKTLLRLSVYQLVFDIESTKAENPVGVIINDAVRLAKKYATDEDASFINGVLGSVADEFCANGAKNASNGVNDDE